MLAGAVGEYCPEGGSEGRVSRSVPACARLCLHRLVKNVSPSFGLGYNGKQAAQRTRNLIKSLWLCCCICKNVPFACEPCSWPFGTPPSQGRRRNGPFVSLFLFSFFLRCPVRAICLSEVNISGEYKRPGSRAVSGVPLAIGDYQNLIFLCKGS